MKDYRQKVILEIIRKNSIETQNQLIEALTAAGVKSTQATISRDIKELRLVKELAPDGKYRYTVAAGEKLDHSEKLRTIFRECVTHVACAQNIVVIKTLPGLASGACSAVDKMNITTLVGTLAGDDTAFLAMIDRDAAESLRREIETYL